MPRHLQDATEIHVAAVHPMHPPRAVGHGGAMKQLMCRDAGFDCEAVVRAESVDELMAQVGPHAREAHRVEVTPELAGRLATLVRDV